MKEIEVPDNFDEIMEKLGEVVGVGKDWYEIGEPGEEGAICGIYAKNEKDGDKVMDWLMSHCDVKTQKESNDETD